MNDENLFNKNLSLLAAKDAALAALVVDADETASCYGKAAAAKDGQPVALFKNGAAAFSLYNPQRDAARFVPQDTAGERGDEAIFFLAEGIASGLHLERLLESYPTARVLATEKNAASLKTLLRQFDFGRLLSHDGFFPAVPPTLEQAVRNRYLPALWPRFQSLALRSWAIQNPAESALIRTAAELALKAVGADYSVQVHFGKIWMRNILRNLKTAAELPDREFSLPTEKTACIIAAGPGLDAELPDLAARREQVWIIATDTALQVLRARGISADAVVTIDGQNISCRHFFGGIDKNTLLVADLCAHPYAVQCALASGAPILFAQSAHPLAAAAASFQTEKTGKPPFMVLDTSAGTVTAAAVNFAVQAGFCDIELYGADFAYGAKPYAKGTYLDTLYGTASGRLKTAETQFAALMFRTPLEKAGSMKTSEVLENYARAMAVIMEDAAQKGVQISRKSALGYPLPVPAVPNGVKKAKKVHINQYSCLFSDFICRFLKCMEKADPASEALFPLLPLAAWLRQHKTGAFENILQDVFNLAKSEMEHYT